MKDELAELPFGTDIMTSEGIEPGSAAYVAAHVMQTRQISRKAREDDIDTLYQCMNDYLMLCVKTGVKVTNASLYAACGVSQGTVNDWASGRKRASDPRYKEFALTARSVAAQFREQAGAEGVTSPVLTIWWQKNYDGFRDFPIEQPTENTDDNRPADPEEIAAKYRHLLEDKSGERMVEEGERRKQSEAYMEGDEEGGFDGKEENGAHEGMAGDR